jgi:hypothetical protein
LYVLALCLASCLLLVYLTISSLDRQTQISYYRVIDQQTIGVETTGSDATWTRVTSVDETSTSVTITVSSLTAPFVLSNDMASFLELTVKLNSPLGDRTVIDGSTNGILTVAPTPWPPYSSTSSPTDLTAP